MIQQDYIYDRIDRIEEQANERLLICHAANEKILKIENTPCAVDGVLYMVTVITYETDDSDGWKY